MDEDSSQTEDEEFRNTGALNNTLDVHYQIPPGELPKFSSFRVRIALRLGDEKGPFTAESNPIGEDDAIVQFLLRFGPSFIV